MLVILEARAVRSWHRPLEKEAQECRVLINPLQVPSLAFQPQLHTQKNKAHKSSTAGFASSMP